MVFVTVCKNPLWMGVGCGTMPKALVSYGILNGPQKCRSESIGLQRVEEWYFTGS